MEKNTYHWILYHLKAMDYGQKKLEKWLAKLPMNPKPHEYTQVISELKKAIEWYKNSIEYHRKKAMSHIPGTEKTKWANEVREAENLSLENTYLRSKEMLEETEHKEVGDLSNKPKSIKGK
jgi:hypothetical protein